MSAHVVHGNERHAERIRRRLGKVHTHQHRADQPRRIRHSHGVNIRAREICLFQRLVGKTVDRLNVLARGDLRHHAAVELVQLDLRGDAVGQNASSVAHYGNSRLVTGRFYRQYVHSVKSFLRISASSFG